jgi:hypothetical protein
LASILSISLNFQLFKIVKGKLKPDTMTGAKLVGNLEAPRIASLKNFPTINKMVLEGKAQLGAILANELPRIWSKWLSWSLE